MTERKEPIGVISWFIARRYLVSQEKKALASTITAISMIGIAVGVAALIVVIGVMDGAWEHLYSKMADLIPHLKVQYLESEQMPVTADLLERLRRDPAVEFVEPVLEAKGVIQPAAGIEKQKQAIAVIGVDDLNASRIYQNTIRPRGEAIRLRGHEALVGRPLGELLQVKAGEMARIILLSESGRRLSVAPVGFSLRIKGFYDTGFYYFDSQSAFVTTEQFRTMFGLGEGVANYVYVRLKDPFKADEVRRRLDLPPNYLVQTWTEQNRDFFAALTMQKLALFIILLLIILVAAFNIIGTLILMVIEKTRAVGILRAIGASEGLILRIFLLDGISIGAMGTLLGVVIGVALGLSIPLVKINMPPKVYNFDHLPVETEPLTVAIIVACSLAISALAALIPARQAAKLNPVEALRYD